MWLPWPWIDSIVKQLEERKQKNMMPHIPIFANLCNSLNTKNGEKINEYIELMTKLYPYVDWFEINISCPNQKWVCDTQKSEKDLSEIIQWAQKANERLALEYWVEKKVILVKVWPLTKHEDEPEKIQDLTIDWLKLIADVCNRYRVDGVVATNTVKEHDWIPEEKDEIWWLSWSLIKDISLKTVETLKWSLDKNIPIIWVWWVGCDDKKTPWNSWVLMLKSWATALQTLTAFVKKWTIVAPYNLKKAILESMEEK